MFIVTISLPLMLIWLNVLPVYFIAYKSRLRQVYPLIRSNTKDEQPFHKFEYTAYWDKIFARLKPSKPLYGRNAKPSNPNKLKPSYENGKQAALRPPKPLYSTRILQRSVFPCSKNKKLCDRLKAEKKVVDCGGVRFR